MAFLCLADFAVLRTKELKFFHTWTILKGAQVEYDGGSGLSEKQRILYKICSGESTFEFESCKQVILHIIGKVLFPPGRHKCRLNLQLM